MPNLTKISNWANSLGISRQQGYAAVERCGIPVTDGQVDAEYATHLYRKHTRLRTNAKREPDSGSQSGSALPGGAEGGGAVTYESSRARREEAEARQAEIKAGEMEGLYLIKADVDAVVFEVARALRDGLTNCARRIAADVAVLSSAEECEEVIEREHRALLLSMSHTFKARLDVDAEAASA